MPKVFLFDHLGSAHNFRLEHFSFILLIHLLHGFHPPEYGLNNLFIIIEGMFCLFLYHLFPLQPVLPAFFIFLLLYLSDHGFSSNSPSKIQGSQIVF